MEDIKVLVEREVNCSELNCEDFVKMMSEDFGKAIKEHDDYLLPIEKAKHDEYVNKHTEYVKECAMKFAERKWKTEKKRQEYINNELANIKFSSFRHSKLAFFDFNVNPGKMGISGACILDCDKIDERKLANCFNYIKDNEYFKAANGWILEDHIYGRPQILLKLPEDVQKKFDDDRESLNKAVSDFYDGCRYFGD